MERAGKFATQSWIATVASTVVVIAALYFAKGLLAPLTLAALLSFLLSPVCDWLEQRGLSRIPAVMGTAILGFLALGIVVWTAAVQMNNLAPKIPEYQHNIEAKLKSVNEYTVTMLGTVTRTAEEMGRNLSPVEQPPAREENIERAYSVRVISPPASPLQVFGGVFGTLLEVAATTGIVLVLVVFFLVRREDLRDRFIHLVGKGHVTLTTQMLEDAGTRVSRYLSLLFLINLTFGISVGIGLYFIGVPNATLWGILAAALRFVPYIGPWIAAAMPIGLSLAISSDWLAPILTVALFLVLELFSNNVLEPWLYGKNTGVSAVAVLVAAVFWTWLWGPVGLLLATPLTVCVLVVGQHIPQMSFLGIMLGNDPVFEPKTRIYQRLLAGDQEEAADLLDDFLEHQSLVEVYDTVLIPALALAETHSQLGELNEGKHEFILETLKELIQDCGEHQQAMQAKQTAAAKPNNDAVPRFEETNICLPFRISCLPARSEADEIAAMMLAQIMEQSGCDVQISSAAALASKITDLENDPWVADVVCVSATPPAAVMHARYLCKRIRGQLPEVKLIVGLWDVEGDLSKAKERIGCDAIVVARLTDAQSQVRILTQSNLPRMKEQVAPEFTTP